MLAVIDQTGGMMAIPFAGKKPKPLAEGTVFGTMARVGLFGPLACVDLAANEDQA